MKYKQIVQKIDDLVETDFAYEMVDGKKDLHDIKKIGYYPFTQEEAQQMSEILGQIYTFAHVTHCKACRK